MKSDAELLAELKMLLTKKIDDPGLYVKEVKGKALKQEFGKLVRHMRQDDKLWEWEWWGAIEPRHCYSMGWCVVRNGEPIAFHCHSSS